MIYEHGGQCSWHLLTRQGYNDSVIAKQHKHKGTLEDEHLVEVEDHQDEQTNLSYISFEKWTNICVTQNDRLQNIRDLQIDSMDKDYRIQGLNRWQNEMLFDVTVEAEDVGAVFEEFSITTPELRNNGQDELACGLW